MPKRVAGFYAGTRIYSRDMKPGIATGTYRSCQLAGCTGIRIGVRWPDGKITWPCSKGLIAMPCGWRIQ